MALHLVTRCLPWLPGDFGMVEDSFNDAEVVPLIVGRWRELSVGKNIDKWLWMLSASRVMTRAEGDCNVVKSKHGSIEADFSAWKAKFLSRLKTLVNGEKKCSGKCKKGKCKTKKDGANSVDEDEHKPGESEHEGSEEELYETTSESESEGETESGSGGLIDVEDLGKAMSSMKKSKTKFGIFFTT
ncbi:unnamed protein product [Ranitomeya imitator]|uniref:Uncharacterized protein n=1 Tax=Ranitomeya imitator TaxID=111125 RepID=A0ABN9MPN7_9NEOB|nr:unnamed protein product [Ranitomeya imitator]